MKARDCLIAWNPIADDIKPSRAPPGAVALGPLLSDDEPDWTRDYHCTGGAAYVGRRKLFGVMQRFHVMQDWYQLVYTYGVHPYVAHRAFLLIDEYQSVIKAMGAGPAKGEPGHDPGICYGRAIATPLPPVEIFHCGQSMHVWPSLRPAASETAAADRVA